MSEARVRISLATGELEVEGSESFVSQFDDSVQELLERMKEQPLPTGPQGHGAGGGGAGSTHATHGDGGAAGSSGQEFGEVLHLLGNSATDTDRVLLAGWHIQQGEADKSFTTGGANKLLIGQSLKVSNAAQCMRQNLSTKRVFKVSGNRWRVSKPGEERLKTLGVTL